jgi:hypothetical protein
MVSELDFEEIDQVMEDMGNLDGITNAIAQDVAKIDSVVKKTTPKKPKSPKKTAQSKKSVVKNTTEKPSAKTSQLSTKSTTKSSPNTTNSSVSKPHDKPMPNEAAPRSGSKSKTATEKPEQTVVPSDSTQRDDANSESVGEYVLVKVKKKPAPEPEPVVYQPNPKVGKFMDIVSPLSDMSIQGKRPLKDDVKITTYDPILLSETSTVTTLTELPENDFIESEDKVADRERIEQAGLDPDAAVGDLANQLEEISDESPEDELDNILQSFDSEPSSVAAEPSEAPDVTEDELEKLADILDIPDHSDAFLENVEIAKRPLGGGEETISAIGSSALGDVGLAPAELAEAKADEEFIDDSSVLDEWLKGEKPSGAIEPAKPAGPVKPVKPAKPAKPAKQTLPKPARKKSNAVLYILLVVLFAILGVSLGVLAFFSGLF